LLVICSRQPSNTPGQSLEEFLQEIRRLSKNCNFRAVSQKENRDGFVRDAFISIIASHAIRQRLLEQSILAIDDAFEKARALDTAKKNSEVYAKPGRYYSATRPLEELDVRAPRKLNNDTTFAAYTSARCAFCGRDKKHNIAKCSARSVCFRCHRKGILQGRVKNQQKGWMPHPPRLRYFILRYPQCSKLRRVPVAVSDSYVCRKHMSTLVESGSSLSYMNEITAKMLNLPIHRSTIGVSMTVGSLLGKSVDSVMLD